MATVEKGNVVLDINDDKTEYYLNLGYNIVDKKGNVLQACIPTDLGALRAAYVANADTIKRQQAEIDKLKAQLAEKQTGSEENPEDSDDKVQIKRGRKPKETSEE